VFSFYSYGVVTNRDQWVYDASNASLHGKMERLIEAYNKEVAVYESACAGRLKNDRPSIETIVSSDPRHISWTRSLKADASRFKRHKFNSGSIVVGAYRPFNKQWMYF